MDGHGGGKKKLLIAVDVLHDGKFDCDKCQCINGVRREPVFIKDIGFESRYCPKQQVTAESWQMIDYWRGYKAGHLPVAGGIADQPAFIMTAIRIIEARVQNNESLARPKKR